MQEIFLLTQNDPKHPGYEVLVDVFLSQEALFAYLAKHIKFDTQYGTNGNVLMPTFDQKYKVQKMKANESVLAQDIPDIIPPAKFVEKTEPDVDMPYVSLTVPSETNPNLKYGVSIDDLGQVHGCTCPAYEHNNQNACKHMMAVCYAEYPRDFGVPQLTIGREFYNDPWSKSKTVSAAYSQYTGNPGSWRLK